MTLQLTDRQKRKILEAIVKLSDQACLEWGTYPLSCDMDKYKELKNKLNNIKTMDDLKAWMYRVEDMDLFPPYENPIWEAMNALINREVGWKTINNEEKMEIYEQSLL